MQESDILLQAIMDGGKHSIIVTHPSGVVKFINKAAERLYGYDAAHFVGRNISDFRSEIYLRSELEDEAEKLGKELGQPVGIDEVFMLVLQKGGFYEKEWTAVREDGLKIQILVSVTAMRDEDGRIAGFLSISQDISERKKFERMKNEFISTVSHELRTPLTSIRGALGLLIGGRAGALPKAASELASLAYRNSERLVHIINDILDIEKIESGKFSFHIRPFDVVGIIRQSLEENLGYGEKYGVRFVFKNASHEIHVLADSDRLLQVLANLLSNAAKFSPSGSEVWVAVQSGDGFVSFSVRDFGTGIPESFRPLIFEKFSQNEDPDGRHFEGTGLGLSITKKLVEAMQGTIGFETEVGKGTTFTVNLPQAYEPERSSVPPVFDLSQRNTRVLICEDDRDVATLLKLFLERASLTGDIVHTLAEARQKLLQNSYSAMTLDLMLPDGDGLELLHELRANPRWQDLPVVIVSAKADRGKRAFSGDAVGLVDWINKPIDENMLLHSLHGVIAGTPNRKPRILHVEDDMDLRQILEHSFRDKAEWIGATTVREAEMLLKAGSFDLVVLDLALPDGSGLELLERLNTLTGNPVPVLILSASDTDDSIRKRVAAVLVKSRLPEERVVETILALIQNQQLPSIGKA